MVIEYRVSYKTYDWRLLLFLSVFVQD